MVGLAEKSQIVDGEKIAAGDSVIALASNGLHTNGYTLVRALLDAQSDLADADIAGESFLDAILRPHKCYYRAVRDLYTSDAMRGMAHITGGGVRDNLSRVLPDHLDAQIDLNSIEVLPVFKMLYERGQLDPADMVRTFNMGVGLAMVVADGHRDSVINYLNQHDCHAYPIGTIVEGGKQVQFSGNLAL